MGICKQQECTVPGYEDSNKGGPLCDECEHFTHRRAPPDGRTGVWFAPGLPLVFRVGTASWLSAAPFSFCSRHSRWIKGGGWCPDHKPRASKETS